MESDQLDGIDGVRVRTLTDLPVQTFFLKLLSFIDWNSNFMQAMVFAEEQTSLGNIRLSILPQKLQVAAC